MVRSRLKLTSEMACPFCGSLKITRSRRRKWFEYFASPFCLPHRCHNCDARFYVRRAAKRAA